MRARLERLGKARDCVAIFAHEERGASAVEFAMLASPTILVLLCMIQLGIFYMAQTSLDAGVVETADSLINSFNSGSAPSIPTAAALKTLVVAASGGMVRNDATLFVELKKLTALTASAVAISNVVDASVAKDILVLRAQASISMFVPGFQSLAIIRSSAIVRRQGL